MRSSRTTAPRVATPYGHATRIPGLTFQVGDWVRFKDTTPDNQFKAEELVQIYAHEPLPKSETKRDGQLTEWTMTDADTAYRFLKLKRVEEDISVRSDASGPQIIPHAYLATTPGGAPSTEIYRRDTLVYTKRKETVKVKPGQFMTVPAGTRGKVIGIATRVSGMRTETQIVPQNLARCFYVIEFKWREYRVLEIKCSYKKEVKNFEAISAEVRDAHLASMNTPDEPHFVDYPL
ncbi:hypothetical protein ACG7TL_005127 [Trametes sanguinea]